MKLREKIDRILYAEHEDTELEFHAERVQELIDLMLEMIGKDYEEEIYQGPDSAPEFDERVVIANEEKKRIRDRIEEATK